MAARSTPDDGKEGDGGPTPSPLPPVVAPRYIVIGAGPAGCALAAALAEEQDGAVVLLEMGADLRDRRKVDKASDWVKAAFTSRNSQIYRTPPHAHLQGRVFLTPRGKGPGGTGLVNAMQYSRGYKTDYDGWPWPLEAIERSYDRVEQRLREAGALTQAAPCLVGVAFEKAAAEALPGLTVVGAHDQPLPSQALASVDGGGSSTATSSNCTNDSSSSSSTATSRKNNSSAAVKEEDKRAPTPPSPYYLTPESYAPMCYVARRRRPYPTSTQTLTRVSPFEAFVDPILSGARPTKGPLRVVFNARSTRLLFDNEEGRRVTGVEYLDTSASSSSPSSSPRKSLHLAPHDSASEVIVCAGAIETPKLLQLSGIGDPAHLTSLGIPVRAALPAVGRGLKDHLLAPVCGFARVNMSNRKEEMRAPNAMYGWVNIVRPRRLGEEKGDMRISIMTSDYSMSPDLIPEIALPRYPGAVWSAFRWLMCGLLHLLLLIPPLRWLARQVIGCLVCVMNPRSQGKVSITSADPLVPPVVDPGYLTDARDLETLQEGVHVASKMLDSQAMRPLRYGPELLPGSGFNRLQTLADTAKFAALFSGSYYHPACSCRLGEVVDPSLRVKGGVKGLRLADASVLPDMGSAGPVGSCFMLGDRCARLIVEGLGGGKEEGRDVPIDETESGGGGNRRQRMRQ